MEGLDKAEQAFFESGGTTEIEGAEDVQTEVVETKQEEKTEVKTEPSKFKYSANENQVEDEHGRKYVHKGAVDEARIENKALRRELEELKTKWTGGEARLNKLFEVLQGKQEEAPDYSKDPLGHLKAQNEALESKIKALEGNTEETKKASETQTQLARFQSAVTTAEKQFASKTADYAAAVEHLQNAWRAEFEEAGIEPEEIETLLSRKGAQFSYQAMQKGRNPAEAVYNAAKRLGYKAAEKKEENKDKDKLVTIAKGQEAEKSLASGKGNADFSLEALATMSDEDMEAFVADPKSWKKLARA